MRISLSPSPRFQATRWSMVLRARGNGPSAQKALDDLCGIYWFPLYAWCHSRDYPSHDAEDLIQGFFLKIIQNHLAYDSALGREVAIHPLVPLGDDSAAIIMEYVAGGNLRDLIRKLGPSFPVADTIRIAMGGRAKVTDFGLPATSERIFPNQ